VTLGGSTTRLGKCTGAATATSPKLYRTKYSMVPNRFPAAMSWRRSRDGTARDDFPATMAAGVTNRVHYGGGEREVKKDAAGSRS